MVNKAALVVSFLLVITIGGVTNKLSYQIKDVGSPEYGPHLFKKPWFLEFLMFIGMTLSWPVFWAMNACSKGGDEPAMAESEKGGYKTYLYIFIPAMGDLVGSILSFTGLLYIGNSTAQMLGSSIIIMVAFNSYVFLGRRFNAIQYAGMATVMGSLVIIGYATNLAANDDMKSSGQKSGVTASPSDQLFGMSLCVLARFVNSIQYVLEEKVMGDSNLHPLQVVGTEGAYGLVLTAAVIMPILAVIPGHDVGGVYEDTIDSFRMVAHNKTLDWVLFMYLLGLWGLNALGMMVMKHLGSVFRCVSRNLQACFVWLIDLGLFYGLGPNGFGYGPVGEPWSGRGSWLQLFGFVIMTAGVFVYSYGNEVAMKQAKPGVPVMSPHSPHLYDVCDINDPEEMERRSFRSNTSYMQLKE